MTTPLAVKGGKPVRENLLPLHVPYFDEDDAATVAETLRSTFVSGDGPECRQFEADLAEYLGAKHVFFTNSCTGALDLALMVKGFHEGSEVIVPNFTFTSTGLAAILNGLKVVLVDVDPDNGNIDVAEVEPKITPKTVAIMAVDYAGNPADMDPLNEVAQRHGLFVVHDTAQSIGATYNGRKTGTLAHASCFSFHGTKNLVTGEGGALVTDDDDLAAKVLIARDKGTDKHTYLSDPSKKGYYEYVSRGNSYVQSNLLAALGISQLRKLDWMNARRRELAQFYLSAFARYDELGLPKITPGAEPNWHLFYLLVPPSIKGYFIEAMRAEGIMANIHYNPLHVNRYYQEVCEFEEDEFPNSIKFFDSLVRIPLYPGMSDGDAEDVVTAVDRVLAARPA